MYRTVCKITKGSIKTFGVRTNGALGVTTLRPGDILYEELTKEPEDVEQLVKDTEYCYPGIEFRVAVICRPSGRGCGKGYRWRETRVMNGGKCYAVSSKDPT